MVFGGLKFRNTKDTTASLPFLQYRQTRVHGKRAFEADS